MAPFRGKPSAVIYILSPSDEITAMCSALASWELLPECTGTALLPALTVQNALLSSALAAHLHVAFKAWHLTYGRWRSLLPSPEEEAPTVHSP